MGRARAAAPVAVLVALAGCASDKSFALVRVLSTGGAFNDVAQLLVSVDNGAYHDDLTYPRQKGGTYRFDQTLPLTFSISFNALSHSGELDVAVTTLDAAGMTTGYGTGTAAIDRAHVTTVTVEVTRGAQPPPPSSRDGGAGDGAPAALSCNPLDAGASCAAGKSCIVGCRQNGTTAAMCVTTGAKKPGEPCNDDCVTGTECFSFGCDNGTTVRTCLQLCQTDGDCGEGRCATAIPCGQQTTPYKSCTRPCDPVANTGCAAGLACFLFTGEIPDCDCASSSKRTGGNGAACDTSDSCQAGLYCVTGAAGKSCRPLCLLASPQCAAGTTCTKLVNPDFSTYGACLPM